MKKTLKLICLLMFAALCAAAFCSCGDNAVSGDPETSVGETDPDTHYIVTDVAATVNKMYEYFNAKDYEAYLAYYDIDEKDKSIMLESLKAASEMFKKTLAIDNIVLTEHEDGNVTATVVSLSTSENIKTGSKIVMKETVHYVMCWNEKGDEMKILSYATGASDIVSVED